MKKIPKIPEIGDTIYVESRCSISNGSSDVTGGKATVSEIKYGISGGDRTPFISVKELPGHGYNWEMLKPRQTELKKEFGQKRAHPSPDIDTPWAEKGDIVNGQVYQGPDIW